MLFELNVGFSHPQPHLFMKDKMKTIQYFHDKINGVTYAVNVDFEAEDLKDEIIQVEVGIAKKHPKDPYVKRIGRQVSSSRMKLVTFIINNVDTMRGENKTFYNFQNIEEGLYLYFSTHKDSKKPHFIDVLNLKNIEF